MARVTKDPQERMEELIDTAEELFIAKGYQDTAISDIVKKVGVAQGTFYYYFKTKEEILDAIVDRNFRNIMGELQEVIQSTNHNSIEKLRLIICNFKNVAKNHKMIFAGYLYREKHLVILDKFDQKAKENITPIYIKIFEQGTLEGRMKVTYYRETAEFIFVILITLFKSIYAQDEEVLKKIVVASNIIEKTLEIPEGSLNLQSYLIEA